MSNVTTKQKLQVKLIWKDEAKSDKLIEASNFDELITALTLQGVDSGKWLDIYYGDREVGAICYPVDLEYRSMWTNSDAGDYPQALRDFFDTKGSWPVFNEKSVSRSNPYLKVVEGK